MDKSRLVRIENAMRIKASNRETIDNRSDNFDEKEWKA